MGSNSGIYKVVLVAHILCAIVGIGTVFLNGLYGAQAKARQGAEGHAISQANLAVSKVAEWFIYAIFVLGFALLGLSDGEYKLGQTWVWLSVVLYVISLGISHGLLQPNVKAMIGLQDEMLAMAGPPAGGAPAGPPPQVLEMERRGKTVGACGAALNLMTVVILALMVFKPGY